MSLPPDALVDLISLLWSQPAEGGPSHSVSLTSPLTLAIAPSLPTDGLSPELLPTASRPKSRHEISEEHNSSLTIHRLPSELLCSIFSFLRPDIVPLEGRSSGCLRGVVQEGRPNIAWLFVVTHVCGYWRRTACLEPTLWNHLALPESEAIKCQIGSILVNRAGSVLPLHIQEPITPLIILTSSFTPDQWSRLRTLSLTPCLVDQSGVQYVMEALGRKGPPLLKTLALDLPIASLPRIFQGHLPSLRSLALVQVPSWASSNDFSQLTYLKLADHPTRLSHDLSMATFLDLLRRLPLLKRLALDSAGPTSTPAVFGVLQIVPLHRLRLLELYDVPSTRALVTYLQLPPKCVIHCARQRMENKSGVLPGLPLSLRGRESGLPTPPTIAVVSLSGARSVDYDRLVFKEDVVHIDTREWTGYHAKGMGEVLEGITTMYVGTHSDYAIHCATVLWKGLLKETPNVRSITFTTGVNTGSIIEEARRVEGNVAKHLQHLCFRPSAAKCIDSHIQKCRALSRLMDGTYTLWRQSVETGGLCPCSITVKDVASPVHPIFGEQGH